MRELVAFVARLHDPLLVVKVPSRKEGEKMVRSMYNRESEREREIGYPRVLRTVVPLDFLDSEEERERFVTPGFSHNSDKLCDVC